MHLRAIHRRHWPAVLMAAVWAGLAAAAAAATSSMTTTTSSDAMRCRRRRQLTLFGADDSHFTPTCLTKCLTRFQEYFALSLTSSLIEKRTEKFLTKLRSL